MFARTAFLAAFALTAAAMAAPPTVSADHSPDFGAAIGPPAAGGAEAVLCVGAEQNVGYAVSFDASQSKGTNPLGRTDIFGIKTYAWK